MYVNGRRVILASEMLRHTIGDVKSEDTFNQTGKRIAYCVSAPDPWLYALLWLMWEGVVQGVAWDTIKTLVSTAVSTLQQAKLAPLPNRTSRRAFSFEAFIEIAGLFRLYGKMKANFSDSIAPPQSAQIPSAVRIPSIEQPPTADEQTLTPTGRAEQKRITRTRKKRSSVSSEERDAVANAARKKKKNTKKTTRKKTL